MRATASQAIWENYDRKLRRTRIIRRALEAGAAVLLVTAAALVLRVESAASQEQPEMCQDARTMSEALAARFGESPIAIGIAASGNLMQLYASKTGTWSIVSTTPQGLSCIIGTGNHFSQIPPAPTGPLA